MVKRRPLGGGVELRDVPELAIALLEHLVERERTKGSEVIAELFVDCGYSGGGIVLGAAGRLGEDIVDTAEELDVDRGVFESGGGVLLFAGVLPHDGGAALGGDDGVDGVLEHEDAIGYGESDRTAGAAFAGDSGDGGDAEAGHLDEVAGNGLCLAALLGADAGICAGEIGRASCRERV